MPVYILEPDDQEFSINREVARIGFELRGAEVICVSKAEIEQTAFEQDDIVVAGIPLTHRCFEKLGWPVPALAPVPDALQPFAGRKTWREPIGSVRQKVSAGEAIFFKPIPEQPKVFTGLVAHRVADLIETASWEDDVEVDCSEVVQFDSEFRCFILNGKVIGVRHYKGDPLVFPDPERIRAAASAWVDAPVAWALDMGVTDLGKTLLVEVNDSYALGAYGLPPARYATMIHARWAELRSQNASRVAMAHSAEPR